MRARRLCCLLLILVPAMAHAEDHDKDVSAAAAAAGGSILPGGHLALAWGPWHSKWTFPVELSYQAGRSDDGWEKKAAFAVGIRHTWRIAGEHGAKRRTCAFAHGLLAHAWIRDERSAEQRDGLPVQEDGFTVDLGAGLEFFIEKPTGLRVQVDYLGLLGLEHRYPRISVGLVHQFGKE